MQSPDTANAMMVTIGSKLKVQHAENLFIIMMGVVGTNTVDDCKV